MWGPTKMDLGFPFWGPFKNYNKGVPAKNTHPKRVAEVERPRFFQGHIGVLG